MEVGGIMRTLAAIKASMALVAIVVACLSVLFPGAAPPALHSTGQHDCAPATPPPVSGPLSDPSPKAGTLVINEVLFRLDPQSQWNCDFPQFNQWLEIYDPQDQSFDLYSAHTVIDSGPNTNAFYLPFGAAIASHSFLTLFPEMSAQFTQTQTSTPRLRINGTVIDEITFPTLDLDTSYARMPDGDANWQPASTPTISASNLPAQVTPTVTPEPTTPPISSPPTPRGHLGTGTTGTGSSFAHRHARDKAS